MSDPFQMRPGPPPGMFATTQWSMIVSARDSETPEAAAALERLCRTYWYPLYAFVRRKGNSHEDAADLTQAFFARFLEKRSLKSVDASLGKFRTFLLTSICHFMANEWDWARAQKRGGGVPAISLDDESARDRYGLEPVERATPETLFEQRWAETVIATVLERLAAESEPGRFETLKTFLLEEKGATSYDEAAATLGLSVPAITSAIHRLRSRFGALLVDEVAQTVRHPDDIEAELRHLLAALGDPAGPS